MKKNKYLFISQKVACNFCKVLIFPLFFFVIAIMQIQAQKQKSYSEEELKAIDVNFLYNYYQQDGNHSPVTGGEGSEKLNNHASELIINIPLKRGQSVFLNTGIDAYTSASSDEINPNTVSGPSSNDVRIHTQGGYTKEFDSSGWMVGASGSLSNEWDYFSLGYGASISKSFNDKNKQISFSFNGFSDNWLLIFPIELQNSIVSDDKRRTYAFALSYMQILSPRLQMGIFTDRVRQTGLLSTPFHRVYFHDYENGNLAKIEKLPENRLKYAAGIRANYFWSNLFISKLFYRFYTDNFGIISHTADLHLSIKLRESFTLTPFYRYYTQTASTYFSPYQQHSVMKNYYTSDYDLSGFQSHQIGTELFYRPVTKLNWTWGRIKEIGIHYSNYQRTDNLSAHSLTLNIAFQF